MMIGIHLPLIIPNTTTSCNLQSTPPQQDPSAFQHSAWHSKYVLLMILSILERKNHLHKTPRILGNTDWQWRWQRQWSYVSATWPTRCLARTFLIAASSLSNKSKLPLGKYINSSVYQFHHVFPINNLMFLRLTQFGCNRGWHDFTVYTTKNIKNLGQKIQTLGKKYKPWAKPQTPHWLVQRQLVGSGLPGDWCSWQTPLPGLSPGI